ncbi:hypothetical protein JCM8097_004361 [Rhodosporidiobolus ruineniae]
MLKKNLLDLPPELLSQIFSYASDSPSGSRGICTALLSYTRANLFRVVNLPKDTSIRRFFRLVHPRRKLRKRTRRIRQVGESICDYVQEVTVGRYALYGDPPGESRLANLVAKMSCLRKMAVPARSGIDLFRSGSTCCTTSDSLRFLHLEYCPFTTIFACGSAFLAYLVNFPTLDHLELSMTDDLYPDLPLPYHDLAPQITRLRVNAGLSTPYCPLLSQWITCFPNLVAFSFYLFIGIDLEDSLSTLPPSLSILTIVQQTMRGFWFNGPIEPDLQVEPDLSRFRDLQHLELSEKTYCRSGKLFPLLLEHIPHLLHLVLSFRQGPTVDATALLAYIRARGSDTVFPPFQLTLDAFEDLRPKPLPSQIPDDPGVALGHFSFEKRWNFAPWWTGFDRAKAEEVVAVVEGSGIVLRGTLLDALAAEKVRDEEERYLLTRREEALEGVADLFAAAEQE